MIPGKCFC